MEIIKRGTIPQKESQTFSCKKCGTVFKVNEKEYQAASQMEYVHDNIAFKCECPVCKRMVYIHC